MSNKLTIVENNPVSTTLVVTTEQEYSEDLNYARDNMKSLIETGMYSVKELAAIADQSQNDKTYERLGTLLKSVSDINKNLIEVSQRKKDVKTPTQQDNVTNNNLFVGSTAEMLALMQKINGNTSEQI